MKKKSQLGGVSFYILLFAVILLLSILFISDKSPEVYEYSDLLRWVQNDEIKSLTLQDGVCSVELKTSENITHEVEIPSYNIFYEDVGKTLAERAKTDPSFTYSTPLPPTMPWWVSILPTLFMILLFIVFWVFFLQQSQGGGSSRGVMSFGKTKAKPNTPSGKRITFDDVAGADEEKEELQEIVSFLKDPSRFVELGARIPKGVLLFGSPGTGKTLLAKAVAGEAGVPFFSISGSDFVEMFVGVGASRVRDLFDQAKKSAPSIIFIDEIDAVGRHRGAGLGGGHDEREQTLNQLLVEMDGFGTNEGVIVLASTNRPDILDPALLRAGRFDREIVVGLPDIKGREEILKVHARGKPFAPDVDLSVIAKTTAGFSGADLENLLNESALLAGRRKQRIITMRELDDAMIKVVVGTEKKSRVITDREKKLTAYHEAGHALLSHLMPTQDAVHQISIIPRGRAGGYTMHRPSEDKYYSTKIEMLEEIRVLLAGRAAEQLVLDDISTGASNDIERASKIARSMVTSYGMSALGPIALEGGQGEVFLGRDFTQSKPFSEKLTAEIDDEIIKIIDTCYRETLALLEEHMEKLHEIATVLLEKEKVDGDEFEAIFKTIPAPEKERAEEAEEVKTDEPSLDA